MATTVHVTALDSIVHVNSLFTIALFLGLAWNPKDYRSNALIERPECVPGPHVASDLVSYQIYSFSSFLFSSLVALALKQAVSMPKPSGSRLRHVRVPFEVFGQMSRDLVRIGMLLSGFGSVSGSVCLTRSLISLVQLKLGAFGCGDSSSTVLAVVPLVGFVSVGSLNYVAVMFYAFIL